MEVGLPSLEVPFFSNITLIRPVITFTSLCRLFLMNVNPFVKGNIECVKVPCLFQQY